MWWGAVRRLPCPSMVGRRRLPLLPLPQLMEELVPTWTNRRHRFFRPGRCFDRRAVAVDGVEWVPVLDQVVVVVVVRQSDHSTLPI